jgi:hypothetical protein
MGLSRKADRSEGRRRSNDGGRRRTSRSRPNGKPYVQPDELARKLVKEMEDHKVSLPNRVITRARYTVFLCPEDRDRIRGQEDGLVADLERQLAAYADSKEYELDDELEVLMVVDDNLELGEFGILAERASDHDLARPEARPTAPAAPAAARPGTTPAAPAAERPSNAPAAQPAGRAAPAPSSSGRRPAGAPETPAPSGKRVLMVRYENRVRVFDRDRIVIGRAKEADLRLGDPNVSRRHAAIYVEDGVVMVEDLDSTNGTLVNGYPVSTTRLDENDILNIGNCKMSVRAKYS